MLSIGKQLTAEQRLHKATTDIIGNDEFVALSGVLMIGYKEIKDSVPTACTDGRNEFYGREFVDKLSDAEFRFVILHECYHKMYRHLTTWKHLWDEHKVLSNVACDYVINLKLYDTDACKNGFIKIPEIGILLDEKYRGMDAQQVFNLLKQDMLSGSQQTTGQESGFDEHDWEAAQAMSDEEVEKLAKEIDEAIRQGSTLASKVGSGGLRDIKELLKTQKDWREVLRDYTTTTCMGKDYSTWRKPSRKYIGMDILMPSSVSETLGEIAVAIDTSGSIDDEFLSTFLGEVKGICEQVKPSKVHVLYWDTEICRAEMYLQDEVDNLVNSTKPEGGGGTMVECVPMYLNEHNIKPECVVVLTDGYLGGTWGTWTSPVLWCIKNNGSAKPDVGVTVHVK